MIVARADAPTVHGELQTVWLRHCFVCHCFIDENVRSHQRDHQRYGVRPLRDDLPPYIALGTEFETDWMSREEIARVKSAWRAESLDGGKRVVS